MFAPHKRRFIMPRGPPLVSGRNNNLKLSPKSSLSIINFIFLPLPPAVSVCVCVGECAREARTEERVRASVRVSACAARAAGTGAAGNWAGPPSSPPRAEGSSRAGQADRRGRRLPEAGGVGRQRWQHRGAEPALGTPRSCGRKSRKWVSNLRGGLQPAKPGGAPRREHLGGGGALPAPSAVRGVPAAFQPGWLTGEGAGSGLYAPPDSRAVAPAPFSCLRPPESVLRFGDWLPPCGAGHIVSGSPSGSMGKGGQSSGREGDGWENFASVAAALPVAGARAPPAGPRPDPGPGCSRLPVERSPQSLGRRWRAGSRSINEQVVACATRSGMSWAKNQCNFDCLAGLC